MRSRAIVAPLIAAGLLIAVFAAPVQAAGATATTIEVTGIGSVETFTTTGGALCPSGTAVTDFHFFAGGERAGTFHLNKILTCADGSGTFTIAVDAAVVFGAPTDQGGWSVVGGTGDYASLRGGGSLVGTYIEGGIIDLYTGRVAL